MEFKGTKGEWSIGDITAKYIPYPETSEKKSLLISNNLYVPFECISIGNNNGQVCIIPMDTQGCKSNANLISVAPDLLEALQEMVRMYESVQPVGGWQGVYDMAVSLIEKALK